MQVKSAKGEILKLGSMLTKGGEGYVYHIESDSNLLAKIYREKEKAFDLAGKINEMIIIYKAVRQNKGLQEQFFDKNLAWPRLKLYDLVTDRFIGFIMNKLPLDRATKLDDYFNNELKGKKTWQNRLEVATNLLTILKFLHSLNIVVGDLHGANVFVLPHNKIALVDCDSFQLGKKFRVGALSPEIAPPEADNVKFFEPSADIYTSSILIYRLLMDGWNPLAFIRDFDLEINEIRKLGLSPLRDNKLRLPPQSPPLSRLSPSLKSSLAKALDPQPPKRPPLEELISGIHDTRRVVTTPPPPPVLLTPSRRPKFHTSSKIQPAPIPLPVPPIPKPSIQPWQVVVGAFLLLFVFLVVLPKIFPDFGKKTSINPQLRINRAVIARGLDSNNSPVDISTNFNENHLNNNRLFYYVSYEGAVANETKIRIHWYKDGNFISRSTDYILRHSSGNYWHWLDYNFKQGNYIVRTYIGENEIDRTFFNISPQETLTPSQELPPVKFTFTAERDVSNLRVRYAPSGSAKVLTMVNIRQGQKIDVLETDETDGKWYKVLINDKNDAGWILSSLVQSSPSSSQEIAKDIPTPSPSPPKTDPYIQQELQEAIQDYNRGQYNLAINKLKSLLRKDPNNQDAKYYLEKAEEEKRKLVEDWKRNLRKAPVSGGKVE